MVRRASISSRIFMEPELGGVGAARAAGDHDGHDQDTDFAQHEDADHVDDVFVGAELAEMKEALLGDDAADQEGNEQDDRHGLPADPVQVMDSGGRTEGCRALGCRQHGKAKRANHGNKGDEVSSQPEQQAPDGLNPIQCRPFARRGSRGGEGCLVHLLEQALIAVGQPDDAHLLAAILPSVGQASQQPCAIGVELRGRPACR